MTFSEARFRPSLEERLESIISGAALMADSSCTRDDRRERIVAECNAVRQALQDLLSEYMNNVSYTNLVLASFLQMFKFSVYNILALIIKKKKYFFIQGVKVTLFELFNFLTCCELLTELWYNQKFTGMCFGL